MTVVAVLALDGVVPFELTMAGQVFDTANFALSAPHYDVRVCAGCRTVTTSPDPGKPLEVLTEVA